MDNIEQALYQQMRLSILLTAQNGVSESPFSPDYIAAWDNEVYPLFNEGASWHKPHEACFKIGKAKVEELFNYLLNHFDNKSELTFYELEKSFGIHGSAYATMGWERFDLTKICRYLYLNGCFDEAFWSTLTRNGECPGEAHSILRPIDHMNIYLC
ncbi:hypothetical protein NPJ88_003715 [Halomonas elongata]|uniref:hypothetical protein n=1 Tax=Halomonas elongata TaxID=2746 RepID=UPI00255A7515|nr:hypothetical protein [Halomonas elongata]MDL4861432.1 hypothetical protein [Halomonas elongata]